MREIPVSFGAIYDYIMGLKPTDKVDHNLLRLSLEKNLRDQLYYNDYNYDWQALNRPLYLKHQAEIEASKLFEEYSQNILRVNYNNKVFNQTQYLEDHPHWVGI